MISPLFPRRDILLTARNNFKYTVLEIHINISSQMQFQVENNTPNCESLFLISLNNYTNSVSLYRN